MGKSKIEGLIMREVEELVEEFKGLTKEPSKLPKFINVAFVNVIWQLVSSLSKSFPRYPPFSRGGIVQWQHDLTQLNLSFDVGHRYDFRDERVHLFLKKFREIEKASMLMFFTEFFPIVKYILPKPIFNYLIVMLTGILLKPFIDDHLKTLDPNNPRDLMDDYLIEMKEGKNPDYSHFDFTEIQEKIQKEIDKVVPRDTLPGLEHRNKLTYLDATINEVQRHCSMLPVGVMKCATKDVKLEGFDIPKGTVVISVAALSHRDPTYFDSPEEFNPSRFLDENGKYFPTCDGFQAFGIGKRQCLGEQFARMELYLMTAALLQNFTFAPPDDEGQMSIAPFVIPNVHNPRKEQKFKIKLRN
ncbi:putative cytochrome P450 [Armadillidium nasatum]|uniref:Putative cytochrome P450 n=1 Tax=Armadillidium nasatum TaxID=96803 RepID=A0A5N5SPR3_9CRUS|nr:putative cytochrome P450 [Armadillidium nasatum]